MNWNRSEAQQDLLQRTLLSQTAAPERVPDAPRIQRWAMQAMDRRRKVATLGLIAVSALLGFYAIFGHDGIVAYQQKQQQAKQLHEQIMTLQKENERLALHDQRLKNDRDTIEYEAREQMHYARPGEVIYTLPEAPVKAAAQ